MGKKKLPQLFLHNDYHEKKTVRGPLKCHVCGAVVDSKSIFEDVHYIVLDEDEKLYILGNCAHMVTNIYSDIHPLKQIVIYILFVFGITARVSIFKDIFF